MARKPRSSIIQTPRHAIFFFAMFILGAIVLSLAKIVNLPSGWEKVIIVGLSLILMITYAVFITVVPATRLRLDAAADNMYYLGFLYTLTSLAVALTVDDTDQILANFGVAISSTLIGIAARVGSHRDACGGTIRARNVSRKRAPARRGRDDGIIRRTWERLGS